MPDDQQDSHDNPSREFSASDASDPIDRIFRQAELKRERDQKFYRRFERWILVGISFGFIGVGVWILLTPIDPPDTMKTVAGWMFVICGLGGGLPSLLGSRQYVESLFDRM